MRQDAPQRVHDLREIFNGLRYVVKTGCPWRMLPHDLPEWEAVYQQSRRWMDSGVFEEMAHDLRMIVRLVNEREAQPTAAILDARTLQSTPESGDRAGYDGAKKKNGSKVHIAVDTLGNLLALKVTAGNEQERDQVAELAAKLQEVTGRTVTLDAHVEQGRPLAAASLGARWASCPPEFGVRAVVDRLTQIIYLQITPNLLVSLHPDYVMTHRTDPVSPGRTKVECQWLFPQEAFDLPGFDPSYAVDFWDLTNRQDWHVCELQQRGTRSRSWDSSSCRWTAWAQTGARAHSTMSRGGI